MHLLTSQEKYKLVKLVINRTAWFVSNFFKRELKRSFYVALMNSQWFIWLWCYTSKLTFTVATIKGTVTQSLGVISALETPSFFTPFALIYPFLYNENHAEFVFANSWSMIRISMYKSVIVKKKTQNKWYFLTYVFKWFLTFCI